MANIQQLGQILFSQKTFLDVTPLLPPFETAIVHSFNDYIRGDGAEEQIPNNQHVFV